MFIIIAHIRLFLMKKRFFTLAGLLLSAATFAQTAPKADIGTIHQSLNKLQVLGSVLYVAAHPDDENTRLLAYLANEKHYRTGYLALTRGDGGQNLIGNEQGELLGLIRTQELLAARRVDGAEQFFTRANDFGFSKGPDETLKIWDRNRILSDVVWTIRRFKPDVIICRFPTTGEGGHGHHTASAILAQEAFSAAADPKKFPEQLKYVQVWQAKRLLWNTFSFGGVNTTSESQFKIDEGTYNPLLGKGYGEMAAESRSNHKTQGFGTAAQRGQFFDYFKTILGEVPKTNLMDGVNTSWARVPGSDGISADIDAIKKSFDDEHPDKAVPALIEVLKKVERLRDFYWRNQKVRELKDLIAACAGIWMESYAADPSYAQNERMDVRTQIISRLGVDASLSEIVYYNPTMFPTNKLFNDVALKPNILTSFDGELKATEITQPYWLRHPHNMGQYTIDPVDENGQRTLPETTPYMTIITLRILDKEMTFIRPIQYKYVDPAKGEIYQPVDVTPAITANIAAQNYIFRTDSNQPQTVQINLKAFVNGNGSVSLQPLDGWKISPDKIDFSDKKKGDEWTVEFAVTPANDKAKTSTLTAVAQINGQQSSMGVQRITYDHIPHITLFPPAQTKLVDINLKTPGNKKIGYIAGAGDLVSDALKQVGYDVHQLTEAEVMTADLSQYQAIITGVRAYNVNKRLPVMQPKLLEYVNNGGTLLVQYNNNNGVLVNPIGPYPFRPVNERVTDEAAKVTFAQPDNEVLTTPNKIGQGDFDAWIQERGLYFVSDIDPQYQTPLEMNDAGESPKKGSLLVANYGKGRFVYTSLAFFRELPAGVPGAYRLFVNLISH